MKTDSSQEPYQDKYTLLENLRKSFADPSLSPKMLRENCCVLAEEYTAVLQQLIQLSKRTDTTQDKLLSADLRIRKQQEALKRKNERLQQEITEHIRLKQELQQRTEELTAANSRLIATVEELARRNQEMQALQQLGEFLQTCESEEETYHVLTGTCRRLFPSDAGYLSLLDDAESQFRIVDSWGEITCDRQEFEQRQCWAVRRGKIHAVQNPKISPVCPHVKMSPEESCLCVPMIAHGQMFGMMHLLIRPEKTEHPERERERIFAAKQRLFSSIADRYAMNLIDLRLRETLKFQATRDPLTGLYNRRHMEASFQREISRAQRHKLFLGVIMIDVDHFNVFNDTYGHELGDKVLSELGKFLVEGVRDEDIACRYGGEELFIILPGASLENTHKRAENLRQGIEGLAVTMDGEEYTVTASLGVAAFPEHGLTAAEVIKSADIALYQAKNRGRNKVVVAPGRPGNYLIYQQR
ncbi:MAG: diguanylate cyclase [Candidatus Electrothrix sp. YB6]